MAISAVVAAVSTASAGFAGTLMFGSYIAHFLISTALGAALNALAPKTNSTGIGGYSINGTNNGSALDHQVIYGMTRVGGARVHDVSTGGDNDYLHRILVFAGHTIESYEEIYLNDEVVTLDGSGNVTSPSRYNGFVRIKRYFGTTAQSADADFISETASLTESQGKWTADHKLSGLAYLYVRFKYNQDVFPNGVPVVSATIKGKRVFDPRTSTTAWSDNPALCVRDYLLNDLYGMSQASSRVDDSVFITAANICDQTVQSGKRYTCNGAFTTSSTPFDILQGILSSMGGLLWYSSGKWKVKAAAYTTPVIGFTDDDFRSGISINPRHSRRDNFNTVKGTFAGPSTNWQPTDYPEVSDPAFVSEDNGIVQTLDLPLPFTTSELAAQRIARIALFRNREQITVSASFSLKALGVEVGDNVTITNSRMGWVNKPFEVLTWAFGVADDGAITINMTLRETSNAAFTGTDGSVLTLNNTKLPDPFTVTAPTGLTAVSGSDIRSDGTFVNTIEVSWTAPNTGFIEYYDFEWKLSTSSKWNSVDVTGTDFEISPAKDNVTYNIRVRSVNSLGIRSAYATVNYNSSKDVTPPSVPTSFSATGGFECITLNWTNPTEADFDRIQIRRGTTNVFNDSVNIATIRSDQYVNEGLNPAVTRFYWVRALDFSGNASAWVGPVSATTRKIANADVGNGAVDTPNIVGQAVIRQVRLFRETKRRLNTSDWVRFMSITVEREAGYNTDLEISFSMDGEGTAVAVGRILRDSTITGNQAAFTTGEKGSQDQKFWSARDTNTAGTTVTYHIEFRRGSWAGNTNPVNIWNLFVRALQVKR